MANERLTPFNKMPIEKLREITRKGAKATNELLRKRREDAKKRKALAEILEDIIYTKAKPRKLKQLLENLGIDEKDDNYFAALSASTILKGIQKGDINTLYKIMELLGETNNNNANSPENKSFNNLIEAIKNVRETKSKTE